MGKTYRTTFRLGARSDTDDADGVIVPVDNAVLPEREAIETHLAPFLGEIEQVPPSFSAAKIAGRRAYDLARTGVEVILPLKSVRIDGIDVLDYAYPELQLEVRCGKGTYIRSVARDLGERLGCGAYVQVLRRTRVGPFTVENATTLETDGETARARLLPPEAALVELPHVTLPAADIRTLAQGREVRDVNVDVPVETEGSVEVAIFEETGRLAGVGLYDVRRKRLRPDKVMG
jgi:tRNA pseudouridine55 synthase